MITNIDDFLRNMSTGNTIRKLTIGPTFGAHGQKKIVLDRRDNSEPWKAVKRNWDGSFRDNGKGGGGMVIKGVDRRRWVTTS